MAETVAQVFGLAFVSIIGVCIVWTFASYIFDSYNSSKQNDELMDNMKKLDKKYK